LRRKFVSLFPYRYFSYYYAFINDLQKLYFIYLLYFTIKIGITGTIILRLKWKQIKNNLIERICLNTIQFWYYSENIAIFEEIRGKWLDILFLLVFPFKIVCRR